MITLIIPTPKNSSHLLIEKRIRDFKLLLQSCKCDFPLFKYIYSYNEKIKREKILQNLLEKDMPPKHILAESQVNKNQFKKEIYPLVDAFFRSAFNLNQVQTDTELWNTLTLTARNFAEQARQFDPNISNAEIYQACRNVWSMNCLQYLLNLTVEITPSIFAYSLLYPYTDNFIDDPHISIEEKMEFNTKLGKRLRGEDLNPANRLEDITFRLIKKIETQFERTLFPNVYESLYAIHYAQVKSLSLFNFNRNDNVPDISGISIEKGGTSVLADGFLVAGNLTEYQQKFMFNFGVLLQLVDDLQDLEGDLNSGILTLFSEVIQFQKIDRFANTLFHLGWLVMNDMNCFNRDDLELQRHFFTQIYDLLIFKGIANSKKFFSQPYLKTIEKYSPYHFSFLNQHYKRLSKNIMNEK
jgi:hypothetical protein